MFVLRETSEVSVETISKAIAFLKPKLQSYERIVELLTYLYQVTQLEANCDMGRFARESKIEYLAENRGINHNPAHTQRLVQKLDYLNL